MTRWHWLAQTAPFAAVQRLAANRPLSLSTRALLFVAALACAGPLVAEEPKTAEEIAAAKRTAVALNYCRTAFYRIDQNPSPAVLADERRKILDNLNLTSIQDEEVVKLYASVLDEISSINIAERERKVVDTGYGKSWQSLATFTAFGMLTDATEMNYASIVRRGATSWWDFRGLQVNRDTEMWKVEKSRLTAIQSKWTGFLDASWKLARKRDLPDRWLLRDSELERLNIALAEPDAEVRLRRLARMEPFMECYPPYWYYTARTQQALGRFADAEKTYERLAELGDGHFRRDEMLAASYANLAAIRDYMKLANADEAARKALACTTDSWEVNLTAAMVLLRHNELAQAEDAVLRNLDADLETEQSRVALLTVYAKEGDPKKILARLDDAATVARTPIPVLLRCAAALRGQNLPTPAADRLRTSLHGFFGQDDFVLVADPSWEFRGAMFAVDESTFARPTLHATDRATTVQFRRLANAGRRTSSGNDEFDVRLRYADDFEVKLTLRRDGQPDVSAASRPVASRPAVSRFGQLLSFASEREREAPAPTRDPLRVSAVETAGSLIALDGPVKTLPSTEQQAATQVRASEPAIAKETVPTIPVSSPVTTPAQTVTLGSPEPVMSLAP